MRQKEAENENETLRQNKEREKRSDEGSLSKDELTMHRVMIRGSSLSILSHHIFCHCANKTNARSFIVLCGKVTLIQPAIEKQNCGVTAGVTERGSETA